MLLYAIGRIAQAGKPTGASSTRKLGLALAQGGEFAFVLFGAAAALRIFPPAQAELLTVAVTVSMLLAALLFVLEDKVFAPRFDRAPARAFDAIDQPAGQDGHAGHVVVAGYGRVGQIISRVLALNQILFTALEKGAGQVDSVRRFGGTLYFGDATRLELLHAATPAARACSCRGHHHRCVPRPRSGAADTLLQRQQAVYQDEAKLIQTAREAGAELQTLFESDREEKKIP